MESHKNPIVSSEEQIENYSIYYEKYNKAYFLFTNHVGIKDKREYTDAIWVYWAKDINKWNPENKAVVLDSFNCKLSKIIGLPSVVQVGKRLAYFMMVNLTLENRLISKLIWNETLD
ncbi:MAG: hypothetical protein WCZ90_19645 [Melioribacteraceae bacterium]